MKVGYIRISSVDHNIKRQEKLLSDYGCEKILIDNSSGKDLNRAEYKKMKKFVREKDINKRRTYHLVVEYLKQKNY